MTNLDIFSYLDRIADLNVETSIGALDSNPLVSASVDRHGIID